MSNSSKQNDLLALDANQATITTASVTIRTLRVSNKQCTQSTFRQLPTRKLVDEENVKILGTIWGWVNYTPTGESSDTTQFVTQFGEELCRCPFHVRKITPWGGCKGVESKRSYHLTLCYKEFMLRALEEHEDIKSFQWSDSRGVKSFPISHPGVFGHMGITYSSAWVNPLHEYLNPRPTYKWVADSSGGCSQIDLTVEKAKEIAKAKFIKALEEDEMSCFWTPDSLGEVRQAMTENSQEAVAYAQRWNELMDRLKTVPQLFIAV